MFEILFLPARPMLVPPAFTLLGGMNDNDIVYVCLPLYHSTGSLIAMGQMTATGKTVVLSRKFSPKNFWKDCIKHKCTVRDINLLTYFITK